MVFENSVMTSSSPISLTFSVQFKGLSFLQSVYVSILKC